ncbi:uncharacterized protein SCHCODRAFT_02472173, partial [Schizophyllum commune H4-8]|uniref:uncharacterized protein n=1 Tax=Schizophyllum commune (strain H4-8 / FGSC 9210) TaxID=578458 RepID=UPI00215FA9CB
IAPASVIEFLEVHWMGDIKMWSGIYRTERDVFALCDTNMLVEAWHRLLKHYFMASKHGRRVDQLVYVLTSMAVPYFR